MQGKSGIYKIESSVNSKFYIGSAANLGRRKSEHMNMLYNGTHPNYILQASYNKYGHNNLVFSVVEECTVEQLISREQYYIDHMLPAYNICKVAGSRLGTTHSEETRNKMRLKKLGKKQSAEHAKKSALARIGSKRNEETRRTMNADKKVIHDDTVRAIKLDAASGMKNRYLFEKYSMYNKKSIENIKYGVNRASITI